ncbi:MAG: M16 family metallopeptidase [Granulosicoccus sp.]
MKTDTPLRAVYFIPDTETELISVAMIVLAGEVDLEGPEGLSHFLEHLVFWHADNVKGEVIHAREGNAWVNGLVSSYYNRGESTELHDMLRFARRVLTPPKLNNVFMKGERDVVSREYDYRVLENPDWRVFTDVRKQLYANHPVSRSVIGTPESIASLTIPHAMAFHKQFYSAENSILLISGNVKSEKLVEDIEFVFQNDVSEISDAASFHPQDWRKWQVTGTLDTTSIYRESQAKSSRLIHTSLSKWSSESGAVQDEYTLQFAQRLLESALPGSLARPLRLDNFIISEYQLGIWKLLEDQVELYVFAWPDEGVTMDEASASLKAALKAIGENGVPVKSFERIKKRWLQTARREGQNANVHLWRAWHHITLGLTPIGQEDHLRHIEAVSLSDLNDLLTALGSPQRNAVGLIKGE